MGKRNMRLLQLFFVQRKKQRQMWLILKELLGEKGFDVKECLSYLDRNSTNFKKGLTVTTFYLAKGLEFDQVFATFPQEDQSPLDTAGQIYCGNQSAS